MYMMHDFSSLAAFHGVQFSMAEDAGVPRDIRQSSVEYATESAELRRMCPERATDLRNLKEN